MSIFLNPLPKVSQNFRDLTAQMNFSNDDFIRTTEVRHKLPVKKFGSVCGNVAIFVLAIMRVVFCSR